MNRWFILGLDRRTKTVVGRRLEKISALIASLNNEENLAVLIYDSTEPT